MKTLKMNLILSIIFAFSMTLINAQVPEAMNYQGVLRNDNGDVQANETVDVRFTILSSGTAEFDETHSGVTTNDFGLINLQIGTQNPGDFSSIDWSSGTKELQVEVDAGSGFENLGSSELLSVPYALRAGETLGVWNESGSDLYYDNGNVGIGIASPSHQFNVVSNNDLAGASAGEVDLTDAPVNIRGDFGAGNGQMTGIGFSVTNINSADITTGAGIAFERTGSNSLGKLHFATKEATTATNEIPIRMTISEEGYVGIGTTEPEAQFHILQPTASTTSPNGAIFEHSGDQWKLFHSGQHFSFAENNTRLAYVESGSGDYVQPSDRNLKTNINQIGTVVSNLMKLEPVTYKYKAGGAESPMTYGFIAQDVAKIFPNLVKYDEQDNPGLAYSNFSVLAVKAIQEQQETIETLQQELNAMKAEIQELKNR